MNVLVSFLLLIWWEILMFVGIWFLTNPTTFAIFCLVVSMLTLWAKTHFDKQVRLV